MRIHNVLNRDFDSTTPGRTNDEMRIYQPLIWACACISSVDDAVRCLFTYLIFRSIDDELLVRTRDISRLRSIDTHAPDIHLRDAVIDNLDPARWSDSYRHAGRLVRLALGFRDVFHEEIYRGNRSFVAQLTPFEWYHCGDAETHMRTPGLPYVDIADSVIQTGVSIAILDELPHYPDLVDQFRKDLSTLVASKQTATHDELIRIQSGHKRRFRDVATP
jgi:hypothetical protein